VTPSQLYHVVNRVRPGLIRVEVRREEEEEEEEEEKEEKGD